jgi:hypothetical protein
MRSKTRHLLTALAGSIGSLGLLVLGGCTTTFGPSTTGSGNLKSESRPVSGFSEVALNGVGHLTVQQTGTESLTIQADDNILPLLTSDVSGNRLTLGTKPNTSFTTDNPINYNLTVKNLTGLFISGSGDATGTNINTPSMKVVISGSGSVMLTGQADSQNVTISGSGSYSGDTFSTKTTTITVSGSGDATIAVSDHLDAHVSGSGSIEYVGSPTVNQSVSGSGTIHKR